MRSRRRRRKSYLSAAIVGCILGGAVSFAGWPMTLSFWPTLALCLGAGALFVAAQWWGNFMLGY